MDTGSLVEEARRLRADEHLSVRQIQHRLGVTKQQLLDWLTGHPAAGLDQAAQREGRLAGAGS